MNRTMDSGPSISDSVSLPSPGVDPVDLPESIEALVLFTLSSRLAGTLHDADPGLAGDYCSRLLHPDPLSANSDIAEDLAGVPSYPLYKHLAGAIERCMSSGALRIPPEASMVGVPVDELLKLKEEEWRRLILEKRSELMKIFEAVDFELHVQEPFFSQLRAGLKTVEGRCAVGNYNRIGPGCLLLFNKTLLLEVQHVNWYGSFSEMLQVETLAKVLPGVETIEEGVCIYRKFYTEEKEKANGVLAISVSKPASQPYIHMTNLLNGLSYDGMSFLLGMSHTSGTVQDALPPPRSVLTSSTMKPHRPDVKGSSLTVAARALAKHVNRSSNGWWGNFSGSDSNKNRLASETICCLLTNCSWMNIHLIQPYESVFEIRVPKGYGARWSKDGSKFIGFLEPYMEEGRSQGWKH